MVTAAEATVARDPPIRSATHDEGTEAYSA